MDTFIRENGRMTGRDRHDTNHSHVSQTKIILQTYSASSRSSSTCNRRHSQTIKPRWNILYSWCS